ncbi:hypothetical protein [Bifidobacterium sp. ESL0704]|uniref:DUF6994 family protein n=1 Tax=Bifidobacterium sp. ESL0704 TaxID=2983219 RepID=UPI0023FA1840|nr:hypothetical protein [Bifidobacterium sp. ESL0704]WEV52318.1 hypothetical protein OZX64_05270 [Bifidobacterium sp. ESL0704]
MSEDDMADRQQPVYWNYLSQTGQFYSCDYFCTPYRDPDTYNPKLYKDILQVYNHRRKTMKLDLPKLSLSETNKPYLKDDNKKRYSTDGIGPSRHYAEQASLTYCDVAKFLTWSRTIGGHMLWPRHPGSINTRRGNIALRDRIDLALYEIKEFMNLYLHNNLKKDDKGRTIVFSTHLRCIIQNEDEDWLKRFQNPKSSQSWFQNFIDFWKLEDFVTKNYEVMSLEKCDIEEIRKRTCCQEHLVNPDSYGKGNRIGNRTNFLHYSENLKIIITKRTQKLNAILNDKYE